MKIFIRTFLSLSICSMVTLSAYASIQISEEEKEELFAGADSNRPHKTSFTASNQLSQENMLLSSQIAPPLAGKGQKLTEIKELRRYFFKNILEIKPDSLATLSKYAEVYPAAFKAYDKGIAIKGWQASLGFDSLLALLYSFDNVKTFKASIQSDENADVSKPIARAIQFYENLVELDISNCNLTDSGLADILESISKRETLKALDISGNQVSLLTLQKIKEQFTNLVSLKSNLQRQASLDSSIPMAPKKVEKADVIKALEEFEDKYWSMTQDFIGFLNSDPTLTQLDFRGGISGLHTEALIAALKENTTLTNLDLSHIGIEEDIGGYANALESNTTLIQLNLSCNTLGTEGIKKLAAAFDINTTLRELDLSWVTSRYTWQEPTENITQELASLLAYNSYLTKLILNWNKIGPKGAGEIAAALKINTVLTHLSLESNNIGNEGAIVLAHVLKKNTSLTHINLGSNDISADGANALATLIRKNLFIKEMLLYHNNIGSAGGVAFAFVLKDNTSLTSIDLGSNQIGLEGINALALAIKDNASLAKINLSFNRFGNKGAKAIANTIKENMSLTQIDLHANSIELEGIIALAAAIKKNTSLMQISLIMNTLGDEGREVVNKLKQDKPTLKIE